MYINITSSCGTLCISGGLVYYQYKITVAQGQFHNMLLQTKKSFIWLIMYKFFLAFPWVHEMMPSVKYFQTINLMTFYNFSLSVFLTEFEAKLALLNELFLWLRFFRIYCCRHIIIQLSHRQLKLKLCELF